MPSPAWKLALALIAASAVYLVGNASAPLVDRDEPRYAQCSRQMLQSGDWVVPRLYDRIRAAKPPGIYWCQASMMKIYGDNVFAARMPSVLASLATSIVLALALWRTLDPQRAVWTIFIFTTSALTIFAAKVCLTDSVLLLWTTIALICTYLLWQRRGGWPAVVILSVAIGFGGLTKGPFILGVLVSTIVVLGLLRGLDRWLERRSHDSGWRASRQAAAPGAPAQPEPAANRSRSSVDPTSVILKALTGTLIITAIVGPWVYLILRREPHFLLASAQDALEHLEVGSEGHIGPPGYHLALIWVTFLPWCLFLPLAIVMAFRNRGEPEIRFALAVVLGTWIFVEVLQTKLPHYMLSAFPALAMLTADALVRCRESDQRIFGSKPLRLAGVFWSIAIVVLATIPWWWIGLKFHSGPWSAVIALSLCGIAYAAAVCRSIFACRPTQLALSMGIGAMAFAGLLFGAYLPHAQPLRLSKRAAEVLKAHNVVHPGECLMLDYKEPSLAFYQGGTIREAKHSPYVLQHLDTAPPWMVVTRDLWDQVGPEIHERLEIVGPRLIGLDYSDGVRKCELMILRKKAPMAR